MFGQAHGNPIWGLGHKLPVCKERRQFHPMTKRRAYTCLCGHHVYPCAGTIFHSRERTSPSGSLPCISLGMGSRPKRSSASVTYKCAWRMCHELRKLMASADYQGPLGGPGQNALRLTRRIGGKSQARGFGSRLYKKTMVMGMVERGGKMRAGRRRPH